MQYIIEDENSNLWTNVFRKNNRYKYYKRLHPEYEIFSFGQKIKD